MMEEIFYPNATYETSRDDPANAEFFAALDKLNDAINLLEKLSPNDQAEVLSNVDIGALRPVAIGQVLMEQVDIDEFGVEQKTYWLQVAAYMGPDYLEALRKIVAFMVKVEGFN